MRRLRKVVSTLALAACLTVAAVALLPGLLGYERYVITGASMTGTYDRGSVLLARNVPTAGLGVGDVITYSPPPEARIEGLVTHRIHSLRVDDRGRRVYRTKGDANADPDHWRFSLDRPTQARAAFAVPYVGYALAVLSIREVRMVVVGLPALLIALSVLARLWVEAGVEQRRRAAVESGLGEAQKPFA